MELVFKMTPPPWAFIKGAAALEQAKTALKLRSTMASKAASS